METNQIVTENGDHLQVNMLVSQNKVLKVEYIPIAILVEQNFVKVIPFYLPVTLVTR